MRRKEWKSDNKAAFAILYPVCRDVNVMCVVPPSRWAVQFDEPFCCNQVLSREPYLVQLDEWSYECLSRCPLFPSAAAVDR